MHHAILLKLNHRNLFLQMNFSDTMQLFLHMDKQDQGKHTQWAVPIAMVWKKASWAFSLVSSVNSTKASKNRSNLNFWYHEMQLSLSLGKITYLLCTRYRILWQTSPLSVIFSSLLLSCCMVI